MEKNRKKIKKPKIKKKKSERQILADKIRIIKAFRIVGIILSILVFIVAIISLIIDLSRWYFYVAFPFLSIIFFLLFYYRITSLRKKKKTSEQKRKDGIARKEKEIEKEKGKKRKEQRKHVEIFGKLKSDGMKFQKNLLKDERKREKKIESRPIKEEKPATVQVQRVKKPGFFSKLFAGEREESKKQRLLRKIREKSKL